MFVFSVHSLNKCLASWAVSCHSTQEHHKKHQVTSERRKQQVIGVSDTVSWKPFSGLPGPNMLRPRGMCPGRVPLLCRVGRARMWEPQGLLHGPVLRTRSFLGRHRNLQLWSQLDRPWLLYRWVALSNECKHRQNSFSQSSADLTLITKYKKNLQICFFLQAWQRV